MRSILITLSNFSIPNQIAFAIEHLVEKLQRFFLMTIQKRVGVLVDPL
jgi:hypothetical protein